MTLAQATVVFSDTGESRPPAVLGARERPELLATRKLRRAPFERRPSKLIAAVERSAILGARQQSELVTRERCFVYRRCHAAACQWPGRT